MLDVIILLFSGVPAASDYLKREFNPLISNLILITSLIILYWLQLPLVNLFIGLSVLIITLIGYSKSYIGGADVKVFTSLSILLGINIILPVIAAFFILLIMKLKGVKENPLLTYLFLGVVIQYGVKLIG